MRSTIVFAVLLSVAFAATPLTEIVADQWLEAKTLQVETCSGKALNVDNMTLKVEGHLKSASKVVVTFTGNNKTAADIVSVNGVVFRNGKKVVNETRNVKLAIKLGQVTQSVPVLIPPGVVSGAQYKGEFTLLDKKGKAWECFRISGQAE